jgi:hypothetical protein
MASAFAAIPGNRDAGLRRKMQPDRALRVAIVDSFLPKPQGGVLPIVPSHFPMGNIYGLDTVNGF